MGGGLSRSDVASLALSLGAASLSVYLVLRPTAEPRRAKRSKSEKKADQIRRMNQVERLIMERGKHGTEDFRVHVLAKGGGETVAELSLWHDIPLVADSGAKDGTAELFNFICEIPKCTRKKFEVATKEGATPIKQDTKKGVLREFKKGDIFFNYGCFPRTWENPRVVSPDTGFPGDNDPLDVCEIGLRQIKTGEIRAVKVLGILAMIDDDETDWKVVVIDAADPWADELNDVDDCERLIPGTLDLIREWFRTYKVPDGKPENKFGFDEKFLPASYAHKVIHETHEEWAKLVHAGESESDGLHLPSKDKLDCETVHRDSKIIRNLSNSNLLAAAATAA
ncbi:hypothetical protein CTAYLR_003674 [Chrysophaeum taylorii]|uniref:inorganic diphosphatase n=1 Tax=Chrysophaeum taylorii TaxID=2483200 RepID=A0AAD7UDD2_9STRA|nr:hypothetical protein CTAYLR_003674 [Chrysophaeum taylorii]